MQIGLLEPENFCPEARAKLALLGAVHDWSGVDLGDFLASLDVLFVRLAHQIDDNLLKLAPQLQWLCSPTTGHTHLDEVALRVRRVKILSLRGERAFLETIRPTPEHTFGLIIALLRRYREVFVDTLAEGWDRDRFRGEALFGNHVGMIGLGRVGYRVASYCEAFGAKVYWYDPADVPAEPAWKRMSDISKLIDASRIVVMSASFKLGQPPLVGRAEIELLSGRYLINTARGELVDEPALLSAIRDGRLAGVATDVISDENGVNRLAEWRALADGRNLILTPHIGGATVDAMARTERFIVDKLAAEIARREISA